MTTSWYINYDWGADGELKVNSSLRTFYKTDNKYLYKIVFGRWFEIKFRKSKKHLDRDWEQVFSLDYIMDPYLKVKL